MILKRIAEKDATAARECVKTYGNLVWTLARRLTPSREMAEAATEEIFDDIWLHCASDGEGSPADEKLTIASIALKRLMKSSRPNR